MRILVVNDDGIYSPGLLALARAARHFGDVRIVAPDVEQSSMGHAITMDRPLTYRDTTIEDFEAYRVNGTPADCVALGTHQWDEVDVVLSGINLGPNLGNACWHSGTLAAAKQAALLGIRGIALSAPVSKADLDVDFGPMLPYVDEVLELLLDEDAPPLVNVNLPLDPQGLRWTKQAVQHYDGAVVPGEHPRGKPIYWFTVTDIEVVDEDTDRWAVEHGYVSLTPLRLDLTDHDSLHHMQQAHPV